MRKDQLTALLAALLIGSRREDLTPAAAIQLAEEIQTTMEAQEKANRIAGQIQAERTIKESDKQLADLLGKLRP